MAFSSLCAGLESYSALDLLYVILDIIINFLYLLMKFCHAAICILTAHSTVMFIDLYYLFMCNTINRVVNKSKDLLL